MKMNLSETNALVFDAYGTLFDVKSINIKLKHHFGARGDKIGEIWRQKQLEYTWLRSLMDRYQSFSAVTQDALRYACKALSIEIGDEVLRDLMRHYDALTVFDEAPEALGKLQQSHRLCILSNANLRMLNNASENNNIAQYFEAILSVDQLQQYKPRPDVYRLAEKSLNLDKEKIAFISTNTWDVAGAKSYGLKVVWLRRSEATMEELGFHPDLEIGNLMELIQ